MHKNVFIFKKYIDAYYFIELDNDCELILLPAFLS